MRSLLGPRTRLAGLLALAAASGPACQQTTPAAPALTVACTANPAGGLAPLTVAFGIGVANAAGPLSFSIAYGDGTQGTDPDARHVYTTAGSFVASFTVTAGGETARCSVPVSVEPALTPAPAPDNRWPEAWFITTPPADSRLVITGQAALTVKFNLCRSSDPDGDPLYFRMDLDGDGAYELYGATGADCRHEATYALGTHTATACLTDVDCSTWPSCEGSKKLHPFQCTSYTVVATP